MMSLFVMDPSNKKNVVALAKDVFKANKYEEFKDGCFKHSLSASHNRVVTDLRRLRVRFYHASSANKV